MSGSSPYFIYPGYSTYFPYLSTDGAGSGLGISAVGTGGYIPYPGYSFFNNDLWYFVDVYKYNFPLQLLMAMQFLSLIMLGEF